VVLLRPLERLIPPPITLSVDLACLTETWLNPASLPNLTDFTGYTAYRLDRSDGRQGGGIAVVVKDNLTC